jgi:hypothetical protein
MYTQVAETRRSRPLRVMDAKRPDHALARNQERRCRYLGKPGTIFARSTRLSGCTGGRWVETTVKDWDKPDDMASGPRAQRAACSAPATTTAIRTNRSSRLGKMPQRRTAPSSRSRLRQARRGSASHPAYRWSGTACPISWHAASYTRTACMVRAPIASTPTQRCPYSAVGRD